MTVYLINMLGKLELVDKRTIGSQRNNSVHCEAVATSQDRQEPNHGSLQARESQEFHGY